MSKALCWNRKTATSLPCRSSSSPTKTSTLETWLEGLASGSRRRRLQRAREDQAFLLQSLAAARQRDAQVKHEIAMMQLNIAGRAGGAHVAVGSDASSSGRPRGAIAMGRCAGPR